MPLGPPKFPASLVDKPGTPNYYYILCVEALMGLRTKLCAVERSKLYSCQSPAEDPQARQASRVPPHFKGWEGRRIHCHEKYLTGGVESSEMSILPSLWIFTLAQVEDEEHSSQDGIALVEDTIDLTYKWYRRSNSEI